MLVGVAAGVIPSQDALWLLNINMSCVGVETTSTP